MLKGHNFMVSESKRYQHLLAWRDHNRLKHQFLYDLTDAYPQLLTQHALMTQLLRELPGRRHPDDGDAVMAELFQSVWQRLCKQNGIRSVQETETSSKQPFVLVSINQAASKRQMQSSHSNPTA